MNLSLPVSSWFLHECVAELRYVAVLEDDWDRWPMKFDQTKARQKIDRHWLVVMYWPDAWNQWLSSKQILGYVCVRRRRNNSPFVVERCHRNRSDICMEKCRWWSSTRTILLSFNDRCERDDVGLVLGVEFFDETIDDEGENIRLELDRIQGFLHQIGQVLILIGFHLLIFFQDVTEQLVEPSTQKIIDSNVCRQLLKLVDDLRQLR